MMERAFDWMAASVWRGYFVAVAFFCSVNGISAYLNGLEAIFWWRLNYPPGIEAAIASAFVGLVFGTIGFFAGAALGHWRHRRRG